MSDVYSRGPFVFCTKCFWSDASSHRFQTSNCLKRDARTRAHSQSWRENFESAPSCQRDQFALLKISQSVAHVGRKRRRIRVIFFGQFLHDFSKRSAITPGKNIVRSFVQFDDAFGKEQHAFASRRVRSQPHSLRKARPDSLGHFGRVHSLSRGFPAAKVFRRPAAKKLFFLVAVSMMD